MLIRTDSDLFDLLHRLFGLGEWDESKQAWFKFRMGEVAKIKRSRTSRGVALEDLATAALYCKAHAIDVRAVTWLYPHILPAIRWQARLDQIAAQEYLESEMQRAIAIEYGRYEAGDGFWYDRLHLANDRAFVLSEWKAAGRG